MKGVRISPRQFSKWLGDMADGRIKNAAKRGLVSGAQRCIPILQQRAEDAPPASPHGGKGAFNTGAYKASFKSASTANGARVWNTQPYAAVIDDGRRASPVSAEGRKQLAKWAMRKLGVSASEAKGVAFLVARKLAKTPLAARKVVSGSVDILAKIVLEEVEHEIDKVLNE